MAAMNNPADIHPEEEEMDDARPSTLDKHGKPVPRNTYMAFAGMFENSPFTDEIAAHMRAERQRQRDEAAAEADREDAAGVVFGEDRDMTATNNPSNGTRVTDDDNARPPAMSGETNGAPRNKYMAFAGIFKDDPFIDDIDAYIESERQRQRDEAACLADLEDWMAP